MSTLFLNPQKGNSEQNPHNLGWICCCRVCKSSTSELTLTCFQKSGHALLFLLTGNGEGTIGNIGALTGKVGTRRLISDNSVQIVFVIMPQTYIYRAYVEN